MWWALTLFCMGCFNLYLGLSGDFDWLDVALISIGSGYILWSVDVWNDSIDKKEK